MFFPDRLSRLSQRSVALDAGRRGVAVSSRKFKTGKKPEETSETAKPPRRPGVNVGCDGFSLGGQTTFRDFAYSLWR